ncbi:MAG: biopolymer transporter ExbD [Alcanivorax sp.]|nr:biopolymer transporter ExbD [Alcanivorax sp.]
MRQRSARAKRKGRHYSRRKKVMPLNLTALMDIFTILVFFLLVNQTNTQQLPDNPDIVLPESIAQEVPNEVLTVQISARDILVQERPVISVSDAMSGDERVVPALVEVLNTYSERARRFGSSDEDRELMILADRHAHFSVIQRVMYSASQTDYNKVSFAVLRISGEDE